MIKIMNGVDLGYEVLKALVRQRHTVPVDIRQSRLIRSVDENSVTYFQYRETKEGPWLTIELNPPVIVTRPTVC